MDGDLRRNRRGSRKGTARTRRYRFRRKIGTPFGDAHAQRSPPRSVERKKSRAGSAHHSRSGCKRRGDDRNEYGRTRYRYQTRRQSRIPRTKKSRNECNARTIRCRLQNRKRAVEKRLRRRKSFGRTVRHRLRTSRKPAHRQSAARPFRTSGRPRSQQILYFDGRRSHAIVRRRAHESDDEQDRHEARRADRSPVAEPRH